MELDMGRGHKENNRAGELNQQYFEQNIKISPGGPGNNISFSPPTLCILPETYVFSSSGGEISNNQIVTRQNSRQWLIKLIAELLFGPSCSYQV